MIGCVLMTLAFLAGHTLRLGAVIADLLPEFAPSRGQLARDWAIFAMCLAGVGGCIGWIQWEGGLLVRLSTGYGGGRSGGAMFQLAFNALLAATLLAAWPLIERTARAWNRVMFYGAVGFAIPFFGVVHGARKYLFFVFFGLLTMWLLHRGLKSLPKIRIAAVAALLLVFFAAWGSLRGKPLLALAGQQHDDNYGSSRSFRSGYISSVADPFGVACLVWQLFPAQEPFRHGRTTLVAVLGFIPRAMWPGKPIAIGKELTRYYVGPFYEPTSGFSVTPTLPGEFFINFGWPGVIGGGLLFGLICRIAITYAARGMVGGLQLRAARVLLPAVFVMNLGEIRADTAQVLSANAMTLLPVLAILTLFRFDHKDGPPSEGA